MNAIAQLVGSLALSLGALSANAQTLRAQVIVSDDTNDGVPAQVTSPQGLVVVNHLVGNGGVLLIENRSWGRAQLSLATVQISCRPNRAGDPLYFTHASVTPPVTLYSGESAEAHVECEDNYTVGNTDVWVSGEFPILPARSRPLLPNTAKDYIYIADFTNDGIPTQMYGANSVLLDAQLRNSRAEMRVRNRGSIPIRVEFIRASVDCSKTRDPGVPSEKIVLVDIVSTPTDERWINAGQTLTLDQVCPAGLIARSANLVAKWD